ncbi:MAG: hypothetical protein AAF958_01885 [Planctomycetota bacterium]
MSRKLVYLWALPNTLIGITIGLLTLGHFRIVDGVIEIHSPRLARLLACLLVPAAAMTLGHVVIGRNRECLRVTRRHERIHVAQYERWGPFFLPAYGLASLWLWARGRDAYLENPFEVEAYANDGSGRAG